MPSYDKVNEVLDDYVDRLEDGYADVEEGAYEDEEGDEEPVSEEALKLLKYREKLKEQLRSKLRKENGISGSISSDKGSQPVLKKFGSFFGPSKPVLADRAIQESKALLETPSLAFKSSSSGNEPKKASISSARPNKGTSDQPLKQVKTKAEILRDIRDYSFLLSDDQDHSKLTKDPKEQNSIVLNQEKCSEPSSQSGRLVSDSNERKKSLEFNTRPVPPRKLGSDRTTSLACSHSKRQTNFGTQSQPTKQSGSITGSESVQPVTPKALPPKKSLASDGKKLPDSLENKRFVGPVREKLPPASKNTVSSGQRSGVSNNLEHKKDPQQRSQSNVKKKENVGDCKPQSKLPERSSSQANLENNPIKKKNINGQSVDPYCGGVNKNHSKKVRRAEEAFSDDEQDYRSIIRNMFGYRPSQYEDVDDNDDLCMEADFDTIRREEMRSAKIAKREDEEELAKILEEERQERLWKKAKMCKVR